MQRTITRYTRDANDDWVAWLDCGHPQHVRHQPPFTNRPWVTTEQGRQDHLGTVLNCVRCDALELPAHYVLKRCTRPFTQDTLPAALQADHTTARGVWGRVVVSAGCVGFHIDQLEHHVQLDANTPGLIPPQVPHHLELRGNMTCAIEFYHAPVDADTAPYLTPDGAPT